MDYLLEREVSGYYAMLLIIPIASGFMILTAAIIGVEWVILRATGKPAGFKDLRSIAGEALTCVLRGAALGGVMSVLGVLPGSCVAWLIVRHASVRMFELAAPVSTLIGISLSTFFFLLRKGAFRKDRFILDDELSLVSYRRALIWGILGWLLGSSWPMIGLTFWLRYPYSY